MKRVAVIGAGAAGLAAAKNLSQSPDKFQFAVFEQTGNVGGTWVYTEKVGKDEFGLPIHSSMYRSLRTNLPKEVMGFPDYPIPEQEKSYLPAADILKFLENYAKDFKIYERIKFYHVVMKIEPVGGVWSVKVKDLKNDKEEELEFDAVMVCNGHYSTPHIPHINGVEEFEGKQLHSHDYRIPEVFQDQRVVVIGAGPSGMDLALEISRQAKNVILSHHLTDPIATKFPDNVQQKPDIASMSKKGVTFKDGTRAEVDTIFYCTGYKYNFPFLSEACRVTAEDNHVRPLYKHLIHTEFPTLCFVGLPFYVCAFSLFDLQCRFFLRVLDGTLTLPSTKQMNEDAEREQSRRREMGLAARQAHMMGPLQGDYYDDLARTSGIDGLPPVLTKLHNFSSQRFLDDLVNYRNDVFKIIDAENYVLIK
ncbi:flavin-containing monooxygenase FMO GS-OX5-like [Ischnura elegans]|uniref:flavin-containing monooxygenase FMO GS-OX5-like n=1 Tax=Ischnura elegans TaxID=197161 RepID=UPI001ED89970|nr:flavin-containing monooxygenase FMO GS-OX5-like [Ischnura elegans]